MNRYKFFYIVRFMNKEKIINFRRRKFCFRDKAVNEEEYNEKNKHYFLPDDHFGVKTVDAIETQYEGIYKV